MYLRRALPSGVISGVLVRRAVEVLGDSSQLEALLAGLEPETLKGLVSRLEDYEYDYPPAVVEPAVPVLLNQLPRLREGRRGMFDFGAQLVVGRVILRLLRRIEAEPDPLQVVNRCLRRIEQLTGRMELIDTVGHRENVGHGLVSVRAAAQLYDDLYNQLTSATAEQLGRERDLLGLTVRLLQDDEARGKAWIRSAIEDHGAFLRLLASGWTSADRRPWGSMRFEHAAALYRGSF